jgi:hypothetical protein
LAAAAAIWPHAAAAQAATPPNQGVQVGDHWTFDTKDEAGTFETFKIEHRSQHISPSDASETWKNEVVVWYAPADQSLDAADDSRYLREAHTTERQRGTDRLYT